MFLSDLVRPVATPNQQRADTDHDAVSRQKATTGHCPAVIRAILGNGTGKISLHLSQGADAAPATVNTGSTPFNKRSTVRDGQGTVRDGQGRSGTVRDGQGRSGTVRCVSPSALWPISSPQVDRAGCPRMVAGSLP
jgi:hypothetical protein